MAGKKKPDEAGQKEAISEPLANPEDSGIVDAETFDKGKKKKKLIIIGAAALLVLGGGGGAAAFFMGGSGDKEAHGAEAGEEHAAPEPEEGEAVAEEKEEAEGEGASGELPLVDVPALVVNMRTSGGQPRYLKIRFMIEARSAAKVEPLKAKLPAIIDSYQPFLRELRPEDLTGSAAVFRIKEELLSRATATVGAGMVKDVLIQDLVQQ